MERSKSSFAVRKCLLLVVLVIAPASVFACKVPVFRYALERWDVDRYTMVVVLNGEPDEEAAQAIKRVTEVNATAAANVEVQVIDVATLTPQQQWQLEDFDPTVETPHLQIFYPERNGQRKLCWEGAFTSSTLETWLSSPLRSKVADKLVAGASAVFVLVECEDSQLNQQVDATVRLGVQQAMAEISIPEGVIPRYGANEYLQQHPEASLDDVLRCDVPLKVDFEIARLAFDDQAEDALRAMGSGLAASSSGPWLIPIFGRGRMLDAIDAKELSSQTVMNACQYMVGECSCTVKTQNPGVDLLMSANWSEALGGDTVVIVDSQAELSPLFVEIPPGPRTVASAPLLRSGAAFQAPGEQDASNESQSAINNPTSNNPTSNNPTSNNPTSDNSTGDDVGMDDPSANGLKLGGALIIVLAGTGMVVTWLGSRSRNR